MADSESPWELAVIGAGAAGLMAAARAAGLGRRTLLLEKNSRAGVKILMSGGTRCNITQATDNQGIIEAFGPAGRFLHAALAAFGVQQTIELFEAEGVPTKTEETGKIFPVSNRAADVLAALLGRLHRSGAQLALGEALLEIQRDADAFRLITTRRALRAANVLLTTGGQSYPGSGTTGDGYVWARQFGHTIVTPRPALTPLTVQTDWVRGLRGITIPDVALRIVEPASTSSAPPSPVTTGRRKSRTLAERRGSLLFTHFGLSGPVALDVSRCVSGHAQPRSLVLQCDFLPNTSNAQLEELFRQETRVAGKKQLSSILPAHLPRRLVESLLHVAGVSPESKAAEASKRELALVVDVLKRCQLPIAGTLGFGKAEVTAGGVALDEVDPRTMQSKLAPGLYFAGEILDLDGPIGGYNFQAAWSTGWLAGQRGPRD